MRHFCIDIDNTVARTDEVMRRVIADYTAGRVRLAYEDVIAFDYYKCPDQQGNQITKEEWTPIHDLFATPRYLWQVEPIPGAIEGLRELAKYGTIHLATSRLRQARRTTVEWLDAHSFPNHDLHFLKHGEKHASLRPFAAAVEDHYEQAVAFATTGQTPAFLIRHPWNRDCKPVQGVLWVDSWEELTQRLLAPANSTSESSPSS